MRESTGRDVRARSRRNQGRGRDRLSDVDDEIGEIEVTGPTLFRG